jgi:hypothetical protein
MMQYNNQPIVSVCGFNDDRAEAWPGRSIWGGAVALFWPSNKQQKTNNQKYGMTLDGWCSMTPQTTTNQKHAGAIERVYKRRCNQGRARKGDDTIILGGHQKLRGDKKLKQIH